MFSSRTFMTSMFILKSLIHLELTLANNVRCGSNLILLSDPLLNSVRCCLLISMSTLNWIPQEQDKEFVVQRRVFPVIFILYLLLKIQTVSLHNCHEVCFNERKENHTSILVKYQERCSPSNTLASKALTVTSQYPVPGSQISQWSLHLPFTKKACL